VAVSAALSGLQANATYYFRVVATNPGGTSTGAAQSFTVPGEALPSLGRCKSLTGTPAAHTGRFLDAACITPSGGASGEYEWAPGAARTGFTSAGGASVLETLNGTKISCQQAAGTGEYSSDGSMTMTIAFSECRDRFNLPCQSQGAGGGEVRFGPLTGRLGFIRNQVVEGKQLLWAGIALRPSAGQYLSLFECSGLEGVSMSVAVEGSVIGVATPMSRMSPRITLRYSAWGGRQKPARFNEGGASVLLSSIAGGAAEQSGLSWMNTLTNQEPLEIKALP
jgi:hypothetical protein